MDERLVREHDERRRVVRHMLEHATPRTPVPSNPSQCTAAQATEQRKLLLHAAPSQPQRRVILQVAVTANRALRSFAVPIPGSASASLCWNWHASNATRAQSHSILYTPVRRCQTGRGHPKHGI